MGNLTRIWKSYLSHLVFTLLKIWNYMGIQSFNFERTWWRLFQKLVVRTKLHFVGIYAFNNTTCNNKYFIDTLAVSFICDRNKSNQTKQPTYRKMATNSGGRRGRDHWIFNHLCNQFLSPLKLWVRVPLMARCTQYNIMW